MNLATMAEMAVFWMLAAVAFAGAFMVVTTREVMRLVIGLGAFLLAVAGYFLYFGMAFLAAAQVFVYVGGVLVLVLFAIMIVVRDEGGAPALTSRRNLGAAVVSLGLFAILVLTIGPAVPDAQATGGGVKELGAALLGRYLPHFETLGALLLATLVAVLAISGRGERE